MRSFQFRCLRICDGVNVLDHYLYTITDRSCELAVFCLVVFWRHFCGLIHLQGTKRGREQPWAIICNLAPHQQISSYKDLLGCLLIKLGAALLVTTVCCAGSPIHRWAPFAHPLMCLITICCCQSVPSSTVTGTFGVDRRPD